MTLTKIWDLSYEVQGEQISLEQDAGIGEVHRIELHPIHVRLLASECGLMRGDVDAWRRVEALERRLRILQRRVRELDNWLAEDVGKDAPDLAFHSTFAEATRVLLDEWCAELPGAALDAAAVRSQESKAEQTQGIGGGVHQPALPLEVQR